MQTKTIASVAGFEPVNLVNSHVALSIALSVSKGVAEWEPLLLHEGSRKAVTGSHRIIAARIIVSLFAVSTDGHQLADIRVPYIDVTRIVDEWCRKNRTGLAFIPFGNLREIFTGTPVEKIARLNKEW